MDQLRSTVHRVAEQYERFPYPSIPFHRALFARPVLSQMHPLAFELGQYLRTGRYFEHSSKTRILVAGAGTFEPLIVARAHPRAEIVAVDFSANALKSLKRRAFLNGLSKRIECIEADLHENLAARLGRFDFIVCTGVLHHSPSPGLVLGNLARLLKTDGVLRLMIYAANSRVWIYALQEFFQAQGLKPQRRLVKDCRQAIEKLPLRHPLRSAFETYGDHERLAAVVDGFFHACDRPISALSLAELSRSERLNLLGFGHAWHSQPQSLSAALGDSEPGRRFEALSAFERLQTLDDLGECAVNPVFWFSPTMDAVAEGVPRDWEWNPALQGTNAAREILAPLMPLETGALSSVASCRPSDVGERPEARFFEAGLTLGCDGRLPRALLRNRQSCEEKRIQKSPLLSLEAFQKRAFPDGVPSRVREAFLNGLSSALASLTDGSEAAVRATLAKLAGTLEPRIDSHGQELPLLSFGDLLRESF